MQIIPDKCPNSGYSGIVWQNKAGLFLCREELLTLNFSTQLYLSVDPGEGGVSLADTSR
jgi:hypothetical protein